MGIEAEGLISSSPWSKNGYYFQCPFDNNFQSFILISWIVLLRMSSSHEVEICLLATSSLLQYFCLLFLVGSAFSYDDLTYLRMAMMPSQVSLLELNSSV